MVRPQRIREVRGRTPEDKGSKRRTPEDKGGKRKDPKDNRRTSEKREIKGKNVLSLNL